MPQAEVRVRQAILHHPSTLVRRVILPGNPCQALQAYRQNTGIPAKLIVAGIVSNGFSIADPSDAGTLDVVGFDASAPSVMAEFSRA